MSLPVPRSAWRGGGDRVSDRWPFFVAGGGANDIVIARYLGDGSVDRSFGAGGSVGLAPTIDIGGLSLVVRADDSFALTGYGLEPGAFGIVVRSFLRDGQTDASFGSGGVATAPDQQASCPARNAVGASGWIVVIASCDRVPTLFRFLDRSTSGSQSGKTIVSVVVRRN